MSGKQNKSILIQFVRVHLDSHVVGHGYIVYDNEKEALDCELCDMTDSRLPEGFLYGLEVYESQLGVMTERIQ